MKKVLKEAIWLVPIIIIYGMSFIHVAFNSLSKESNMLYFVLYFGYHVLLLAPMYAALAIIVVITKKIRKVS